MNKMRAIARYEFTTNVRRWEFLLLTIALPLFTAGVIVLASVPNYLHLRSRQMETRGMHVGVIDRSGTLSFPRVRVASFEDGVETEALRVLNRTKALPKISASASCYIETFKDVADGERALMDRRIEYLYVFAADYRNTGQVEVVTRQRSPFDVTPRPPMADLLREQFLKGKVDGLTLKRVRVPMVETAVVLDDKGTRMADAATAQIVSLVLPYAMMALLLMALLGSSTYIVRGLVEEKESRIQEVLLSSVRPVDLFYGKIVGLGALGLFQVLVWLMFGLPFAINFLKVVEIPPSAIAIFLLYFILGYMLYAALSAGIGAIGSTEKESNQIFAIFVLLISSPMLFLPILLDSPHGWLERVFSTVPFTSPLMMVLRAVNGGVTPLDFSISLAVLVVSVWAAMRLSLKVFKLGLLLYGKSPTPAEIWRALRGAGG